MPACADICNLAAWAGKGRSPWRNVQGDMNVDLESLGRYPHEFFPMTAFPFSVVSPL